mmetsp:Transcript_16948/g.38769  ORF Transcript_16948/g.38769 Transcript_16948/m.38769 type:complete len:229 (+) Transcript_16948:628-1314(+)
MLGWPIVACQVARGGARAAIAYPGGGVRADLAREECAHLVADRLWQDARLPAAAAHHPPPVDAVPGAHRLSECGACAAASQRRRLAVASQPSTQHDLFCCNRRRGIRGLVGIAHRATTGEGRGQRRDRRRRAFRRWPAHAARARLAAAASRHAVRAAPLARRRALRAALGLNGDGALLKVAGGGAGRGRHAALLGRRGGATRVAACAGGADHSETACRAQTSAAVERN